MLRRGLTYSHYGYAYEGYWETVFGGDRATDHFSIAIQRLHISVIPDSLPCRVFERDSIETYIRNAIQGQGITHPVYICGVPGTGKTATVLATINSLKKEAERGDLPEFSFIEINCLRLKSPADACKSYYHVLSITLWIISSKLRLLASDEEKCVFCICTNKSSAPSPPPQTHTLPFILRFTFAKYSPLRNLQTLSCGEDWMASMPLRKQL